MKIPLEKDNYNDKRKNILMKLDKDENVSNLELGMYNLTPYFQENQENLSLTEMIMIMNNHERKVSHLDKELYLSPPQYKALKSLADYERIILSAPTSFGKTLLLKEFIHLNKPKRVVYIVPTNALAYELERDLKENKNFSDYTVFDKYSPIQNNEITKNEDEKLFFLGTQEKYLEISNYDMGIIDLFVIDESYKLQESVGQQRAYKLSKTFLDSIDKKSKKIVLLTPCAKFNGFEKYKFNQISFDFNAVEKNFIKLNEKDFISKLLSKQNEKTILYFDSPKKIYDAYAEIAKALDKKTETEYEFVKMIENEIHPDWCVVKLLKLGILTHHGQMPKYVQNRMITLFNQNNKYNLLCGTNSISEGINTVTKNLFFHPSVKFEKKDKLLLKNTIGRAGRLGKYPIGHIYSTNEDIERFAEDEIEITLAISDEKELSEINDSKDNKKIEELSKRYSLKKELIFSLLDNYKISLSLLQKMLDVLRNDLKYCNISNLPYISKNVFNGKYPGNVKYDGYIICGYLQNSYIAKGEDRAYLNTFNDRIVYLKDKLKLKEDNSQIINYYMQFIYSTLEYYILPIVNIAIEINQECPSWSFGKNVYDSIKRCYKLYTQKIYGPLDFERLSEEKKRIVSAFKDYGMISIIKDINDEILEEINKNLCKRYSTFDVIRAIKNLANTPGRNNNFFLNIKKKYFYD